MDPLTALRNHLRAGHREVPINGDTITLGEYTFPKHEETAFKKKRSDNEYYTLLEVLFFSMNTHLGPSDYGRKTMAEQIGRVDYLDQQDMKKYLLGEVDDCDKINRAKMSQYKRRSTGEQPKEKPRKAPVSAPPPVVSNMSTSVISLTDDQITEHRREHAQQLDLFMQAARTGITDEGYFESKVSPEFMEADRTQLAQKRSREVPISSRNSAMHKPGANLAEETLRWYEESVKNKQRAPSKGAPHVTSSAIAPSKGGKRSREDKPEEQATKRRPRGYPIIIVPNSLNGVLSSMNARELLEGGTHVSIAQKREQGARREARFAFERVRNGQTMRFEVVDDGTRLTESEWERVVVVFASGEAWQFKKWKWSEPVELFQHVLGLHAMYEDEPVKATVASWNVRIVKMSKLRRHLDSIAYNDIWREIDNWMQLNCSWLVQQALVAESK